MSDVVERGKTMLTTIEYAKYHGIGQAYPDSSVAAVVGDLVAEVERLRWQVKHGGDHMCEECWPLDDDDASEAWSELDPT